MITEEENRTDFGLFYMVALDFAVFEKPILVFKNKIKNEQFLP